MTKDNTKKVENLFNKIKDAFIKVDKKQQEQIVDNLTEIKNNAEELNQQRLILESEIKLKNAMSEIEAIKAGYDRYVLHDDVDELIKNLKTKDGGSQLAFNNLEKYPRVIPQKNAELIKKLRIISITFTFFTLLKKKKSKKKKSQKIQLLLGSLSIQKIIT